VDIFERILVLAVSQRDAESTCGVLERVGLSAKICFSLASLESEIEAGAGGLILAKEALNSETVLHLARILNRQPPWSFLPVIMLIGAGDLALGNEESLRFLAPLRNLTFLERPVRVGTLTSIALGAIADRRRQYEVRDLIATVEKAKQEAIEASQAKSSFLANMSHEIRTPLGAILGFSELLMEPTVEERDKLAYMKTIKRNGQLLSALIDDILDLAKVESGRVAVENIDVSVRELISEVISALAPQASLKSIPISVDWATSVPNFIRIDPVRLKQIILNVVGNAIKFTSTGEIRIQIFTSNTDSETKNCQTVHFEVTDTGVGVSPSQAGNLFQPFAQADSSITRRFGGTGLGLVLSKKLAHALGGDLVLKASEVGRGSKFEIVVACVPSAHQSAHLSSALAPLTEGAPLPLAGRKILLVDDSKDNQVLIGRMLAISGAEVNTADDGIAAVESALKNDFDLVLMDIQMPRLSGDEATKRLREKGYRRPVIALTAHALQEDRKRCFEAGCNDYLTKPVQRGELIRAIGRLMDPL
jgi:signal transduction histidine kinase